MTLLPSRATVPEDYANKKISDELAKAEKREGRTRENTDLVSEAHWLLNDKVTDSAVLVIVNVRSLSLVRKRRRGMERKTERTGKE